MGLAFTQHTSRTTRPVNNTLKKPPPPLRKNLRPVNNTLKKPLLPLRKNPRPVNNALFLPPPRRIINGTKFDIISSAFHKKTWQQSLCHVSHIHVSRFVDSAVDHPAGIACKCDWVMVSATNAFNYRGIGNFFAKNTRPQVIYVGTRILPLFATLVDHLPSKVVIVSGINDETYPLNVDPRFDMSEHNMKNFYKIANHSKVIHWFIENLSVDHPKVSPLPIGFVHNRDVKSSELSPDQLYRKLTNYSIYMTPWTSRKVSVLSIDKSRDGIGVWRDRRVAFDLCEQSVFCVTGHTLLRRQPKQQMEQQQEEEQQPKQEKGQEEEQEEESQRKLLKLESKPKPNFKPKAVAPHSRTSTPILMEKHPHEHFMHSVSQAQFTVMVHGGGIDPCPKLFEVLLLGSIPIIEKSPVSRAYSLPRFPVAVVPSIKEFLRPNNTQASLALLSQWTQELAPYFLNETLRKEVLYHLTSDYWWGVINSTYIQQD